MSTRFRRLFSIAAASAALLGIVVTLDADDGNLPWYPSLMAFEHYDMERTHLFEQAQFNGRSAL